MAEVNKARLINRLLDLAMDTDPRTPLRRGALEFLNDVNNMLQYKRLHRAKRVGRRLYRKERPGGEPGPIQTKQQLVSGVRQIIKQEVIDVEAS